MKAANFLCMMLLTASLFVGQQAVACHSVAAQTVKFLASDGELIELNFADKTLSYSGVGVTRLQNCSDDVQTCFTNNADFSFSFYKKCSAAELAGGKRLRFSPKVIIALHSDSWVVFEESPTYMFHYVEKKGIVGIYVGKGKTFDFRRLLGLENVDLTSREIIEYKIAGSHSLALCE